METKSKKKKNGDSDACLIMADGALELFFFAICENEIENYRPMHPISDPNGNLVYLGLKHSYSIVYLV